jgi:hypothetical protein
MAAFEQAFALEVVEPLDQVRWLAHRDRHGAARHGRRDDELDALAAGQRGRQQRALLVDLLVAEGGHGGGQRQAALLRHLRCRYGLPAAHSLDLQLAGPVHADLQHARRVELFAQRAQELDHRGGVAAPAVT